MPRAALISLSHGGGPLPLLGHPSQAALAESMRTRVPKLLKLSTPEAPRAIVIVTAHWMQDTPTVSNAAEHPLLYDYSGFPPEAYKVKHDAPGSPEVAAEVFAALADAGLRPRNDATRGWDHGLFVPMKLIDPSASVPLVQLSVLKSEDPAIHFAMGRALARLLDENIAIVGSGSASFHNLRALFSGEAMQPDFKASNRAWSSFVTDAVTTEDSHQREGKFLRWREWPSSFKMHPNHGADHFLPLVVCAGAAGDTKAEFWVDSSPEFDDYSYYWK